MRRPLTIAPARVISVTLTREDNPRIWDNLGEYATIGAIEFEFTSAPVQTTQQKLTDTVALPLLPNLKHYPVTNEIVSILVSAGPQTGETASNITFYYLPPTNVWNSIHHNAVPEEVFSDIGLQPAQKKDYQQVGAGSVRRVSDGSTEIKFGNGFKEKINIKGLQPYAGDVILEGRWGNTLRLGSTTENKSNGWSSTGAIGDPIVILKNGQFTSDKPAWVPQDEDLRYDQSSIYLTSTQKLKFPAYPQYQVVSFNNINPPTALSEFTKPQTILTSDRVTLFGRSSIINNSPLVHFNTSRFNIDCTGETTIQASRVNLGSGNPEELQPALKGDSTEALLKDILQVLTALTQACVTATGTVPIASLQKFAVENLAKVQALSTSTIKSNDTFIV